MSDRMSAGQSWWNAMTPEEREAAKPLLQEAWKNSPAAKRARKARERNEADFRNAGCEPPRSVDDWTPLALSVGVPRDIVFSGEFTGWEVAQYALAWDLTERRRRTIAAEGDGPTSRGKPGGYTQKELREECENEGVAISPPTFRRIREAAEIATPPPSERLTRRYSNNEIRRMADEAEAKFRNGEGIAAVWRAIPGVIKEKN